MHAERSKKSTNQQKYYAGDSSNTHTYISSKHLNFIDHNDYIFFKTRHLILAL